MADQAWNKRNTTRITHDGVTLALDEWSRRTGIPVRVLRERIKRHWSEADLLTTPYDETRWRVELAPKG